MLAARQIARRHTGAMRRVRLPQVMKRCEQLQERDQGDRPRHQCAINTGTVMERSTVREVPPKTHSRARL